MPPFPWQLSTAGPLCGLSWAIRRQDGAGVRTAALDSDRPELEYWELLTLPVPVSWAVHERPSHHTVVRSE